MAYSILGISDPRMWGVGGDPDSLQSMALRFGTAVNGGMYDGMKLGSALTDYGTRQRLAGAREDGARQALNTAQMKSQNEQLVAMAAQQRAACNLDGWRSPGCQRLRMTLFNREGVDPATGGSTTPTQTTSTADQAAKALGITEPQMTPDPNMGFDMNAFMGGADLGIVDDPYGIAGY